MSVQLILSITVSVKKIKGAARQCYGDGDGIVRCEQTFMMLFTRDVKNIKGAAHINVEVDGACKQDLTQTLHVNVGSTSPNANVTREQTITLLPPLPTPPPCPSSSTCTCRINRKQSLCVLMFRDLLLSAYYYYYQWSWWSCTGSDDCSSEHRVLVSSRSFRFVNWTIQAKLKRNYTRSWHTTTFRYYSKHFL